MFTNTNTVVNAIRYDVKGRPAWVTFVTENQITKENLADAAKELAALAFPKEEPVQKRDGARTVFGNAVQAAAYNLRTALATLAGDDDDDETEETEETEEKPVNLLTRAGLKAELEDVIAAWKAAQENN